MPKITEVPCKVTQTDFNPSKVTKKKEKALPRFSEGVLASRSGGGGRIFDKPVKAHEQVTDYMPLYSSFSKNKLF